MKSRSTRTHMAGMPARRLLSLTVSVSALLASVAAAAPTPLPIASLIAGGATWGVLDQLGCNPSVPGALAIDDAILTGPALADTYDGGLCMLVGTTQFASPTATVDLTGSTLTAGPITMSGLDVTYQYEFLASRPAVRALATFTNPSSAPITVPVTFEWNMGSDARTITAASSSGDSFLDATDRWAMTGGDVDPTVDHVLAGPGTVSTLPSASGLGRQASGCSTTVANPDSMCTTYTVTVPAGATRRLMLVDELAVDPAAALPIAESYDARATILGEVTADLSTAAKAEIVNWDFSAAPVPPVTPDTAAPIVGSQTLTHRTARRGVARVLGFSLSEPAVVRVTIAQLVPGHRSRTTCRTTLTTGPRCTKVVTRGTVTATRAPGSAVQVSIATAKLPAGTYRLSFTATDPAGNVSSPKTIGFTVTK